MKKPLSIVLSLVFLFNVIGYYAVYWGILYQARIEMTRHLDAGNYSENETVTLKIPLTVPYYADGKDYERVHGSFEHEGEFFKLVKQKFERDTLYVVCIRDNKEKRLFNAMIDFVKVSNDLPASSQQTLKLLGSFTRDYFTASHIRTLEHQGWSQTFTFIARRFNLLVLDFPVFSPPPESVS